MSRAKPFLGKRLQWRCHRWIRAGQAIQDHAGYRARIAAITAEGVRVEGMTGPDWWAATFAWCLVFRDVGSATRFTKVWRPVP